MNAREGRAARSAIAGGTRSGPGPLFTVVMPTHDYAAEIGLAIESVIAQAYQRWELIVVADGCADDTADVVRSFGDHRIRLIDRPEHCGCPGLLRNAGVSASGGDIVCYLDHDDAWDPEHLFSLATAYRAAEVRVLATGCRRVARDGRLLGQTVPVNLAWHPELQVVSPIFEPSRVSHRRDVLDPLGGWATDNIGLEDWDLWLRLADAGESFTLLPQQSVRCTLRPDSRRFMLGHRYLLTFGTLLDEPAARKVLEEADKDEARRELADRYRDDVVEWYEALAASGQLRLPAGMSFATLLAELRADIRDFPFRPHIRPSGDGYVLCRVLACRDRAHAERVVAVNRHRTPRSSAYLADLMAAVR
jgi:glycosyltransferase involved in cell wall biosynthesis